MPDGVARGLPRRAALDYGTAIATGTDGVWLSNTVAWTPPDEGQFVIAAGGQGVNGWMYNPSATAMVPVRVAQAEQGSGTVSCALAYCKQIEGIAWPSTFYWSMEHTGNYAAIQLVKFTPGPGFKGICYRTAIQNFSASTSATWTPPTNTGPHPGGIAIAAWNMSVGGAGPNSISGTGWTSGGISGVLGLAYYTLSMTRIETPPTVTISSTRSDTWAGCFAYFG